MIYVHVTKTIDIIRALGTFLEVVNLWLLLGKHFLLLLKYISMVCLFDGLYILVALSDINDRMV